jgi:hypothetical protein
VPDQVITRIAYEVPRGDAFSKYNENDFVVRGDGGLRVNIEGGEIVEAKGDEPLPANAIQVRVKDRIKFNLKITGFDEFRDVAVKIDPY